MPAAISLSCQHSLLSKKNRALPRTFIYLVMNLGRAVIRKGFHPFFPVCPLAKSALLKCPVKNASTPLSVQDIPPH
jgi:hypothetical protein